MLIVVRVAYVASGDDAACMKNFKTLGFQAARRAQNFPDPPLNHLFASSDLKTNSRGLTQ